jgi:hypothetical protein
MKRGLLFLLGITAVTVFFTSCGGSSYSEPDELGEAIITAFMERDVDAIGDMTVEISEAYAYYSDGIDEIDGNSLEDYTHNKDIDEELWKEKQHIMMDAQMENTTDIEQDNIDNVRNNKVQFLDLYERYSEDERDGGYDIDWEDVEFDEVEYDEDDMDYIEDRLTTTLNVDIKFSEGKDDYILNATFITTGENEWSLYKLGSIRPDYGGDKRGGYRDYGYDEYEYKRDYEKKDEKKREYKY